MTNKERAVRYQRAAEACKKARENLPPYPTALLDSLGACPLDNKYAKSPQPQFRGWTWFVGGCPDGMIPNNVSVSLEKSEDWDQYVPDDIDLDDIHYMGMWRGRTSSKDRIIYCVIPSFTHGEVSPGGIVDVGEEKIRIGQYTQQELDDLVRKGWDIMQQMIKEKGRYVPGGIKMGKSEVEEMPSPKPAAFVGANNPAIDVDHLFTYHAPTPEQLPRFASIREGARIFAHIILNNTKPGPDQTFAIRQLGDCVMTANKSIALERPQQTQIVK